MAIEVKDADLYKDMMLKLQYYKEEVIKSFIRQGYYPSNDEIVAALEDIDYRSALFETYMSKEGSLFNTKEINYMFECIYKDLEILYSVLQDILIKDYNDLRLYIETHIADLESTAKELEARCNEEMARTVFGNTIFFRAGNWNISTNDEYTIVDFGELNLIQGSEIVLFADVENIEANKVSFKLTATNDEQNKYSFDALPYNYNDNTYTVPGEMGCNKYKMVLAAGTIVNGNISVNLATNPINDYKILGGVDKMQVTYKDDSTTIIRDFAYDTNQFVAEKACYIQFYYVDGDLLEYNFNQKPNHCNFSIVDGYVSSDVKIRKVFLDVPAGFACYFKKSNDKGEIWAVAEDGIPNTPNTLLYTGNRDIEDFEIREYVKSNLINYNFKMYIKSTKDVAKFINSVCIKQLD